MPLKKKKRRRRCRPKPPERGLVFLDESAFITVVVAASEAYRRECYGALLGTRHLGRVYIKTAFAYQTAHRTPKSVELIEGRRRTVRKVLQAFPRYDYIGEFHSHPGYGDETGQPVASKEDLSGVRPGNCELVVAVRKARAVMPWKHCADGTLSGVAGRYFLKLKVYLPHEMKSGSVRGRPVGLRCDYAVKTASSRRLLKKWKTHPGP